MFPNPAPEGRTDTLQRSYIPQLLAEYIQYKYIYSTDKYSSTQTRCQILRGFKFSAFVGGVKLSGVTLSWSQIVCGVNTYDTRIY